MLNSPNTPKIFTMHQSFLLYGIYAFLKHRVILTTSNRGECESMDKQHILKFQGAEASYILGYNIVKGSCAAKPFLN